MSGSLLSLAELFPDGNYEFHLTLRRTDPRAFFSGMDASGRVLAERRKWLRETPARYAALLPDGEPLRDEFVRMAATWTPDAAPAEAARQKPDANRLSPAAERAAHDQLLAMGGGFEPDILFLSRDEAGQFRLRGGALCFPTGWALEEKLGHTLEFIHGVVPGLNGALGGPIHQFLSKLKPGVAYLRHNWGIAATDELNLHPSRQLAPPHPPVQLDRLWLRVEHQALVALPETRGIVFGIRIALHRLTEVAEGPARAGLRRALESMPRDLLAYKRLDTVAAELIRQL